MWLWSATTLILNSIVANPHIDKPTQTHICWCVSLVPVLRLVFEGALLKLAGKPNELANNCRDQGNTQKLHTHIHTQTHSCLKNYNACIRGRAWWSVGLTRRLGESEETEVFICASLCCTWPNQTRRKSFLFYKSALDQLRASSPHQTCFAQKEQREKEKKARKRRREWKSQDETTIWQHEKCRFQSAAGQPGPKYERQRSKCKVLSNRATLKGIWSNEIEEEEMRLCVILSVISTKHYNIKDESF